MISWNFFIYSSALNKPARYCCKSCLCFSSSLQWSLKKEMK